MLETDRSMRTSPAVADGFLYIGRGFLDLSTTSTAYDGSREHLPETVRNEGGENSSTRGLPSPSPSGYTLPSRDGLAATTISGILLGGTEPSLGGCPSRGGNEVAPRRPRESTPRSETATRWSFGTSNDARTCSAQRRTSSSALRAAVGIDPTRNLVEMWKMALTLVLEPTHGMQSRSTRRKAVVFGGMMLAGSAFVGSASARPRNFTVT